ncbi:hypothetical protein O3P69_008280 [Scylla paramamosain]|uniref:Pro-resilin n=1 Tax=Scylla paramamosain TaxID=85552 RepID=A0AAW0SD54_SCYPA
MIVTDDDDDPDYEVFNMSPIATLLIGCGGLGWIAILLALVAVAVADSDEFRGYRAPSSEESYESSEAQYNFQWSVDHDPSSNEYGHQEARDGDNTKGSYYVELPDGRVQNVAYYVNGGSGYIADVTYTGSAESFESDESNESFRYYGSNESK